MNTHPFSSERYHALDALRATMMALGLVLHTGINYLEMPISVWPYKDTATHPFFDVLILFIHLFRMPVFFVVAGFFAGLLYMKRGNTGMLKNRVKRILFPLLLSYWSFVPLSILGFSFLLDKTRESFWNITLYVLSSPTTFLGDNLVHLWFLYYLLLLYMAALLMLPLLNRLRNLLPLQIGNSLSALVTHGSALPVWSVLTFLSLIPMGWATLDTSFSWIPVPHILLSYSVFFAYGWLLYRQRQRLISFQKHWKAYLLAGLALFILYYLVAMTPPFTGIVYMDLPAKGLAALVIWLIIYASIGFFVLFFSNPSPLVRYLSDASYWIYLLHLPVVLILTGLLSTVQLSAFVKFILVLSGTLLLCLLTYHYLVRSTWVGFILNGKRYRRALPQIHAEPMQTAL